MAERASICLSESFFRLEPKAGRYSWAVVSWKEQPKDSNGLMVVKVLENAGHIGPVTTWDERTWRHVHGPVVVYREEARQIKQEAIARLRLRRVTQDEHYGFPDRDW